METIGRAGADFAPPVLEEIRVAAVAGAAQIRGGLEVGGILLGERRDGAFKVTASSAFQPEYALGPTYALSDKDHERLKAQFPPKAVGWFRSTRKDDLAPADRDRDMARRIFAGTDSLLLVVRPSQFGPSLARAYRVPAQGGFQRLGEFEIEMPKRAVGQAPSPRSDERQALSPVAPASPVVGQAFSPAAAASPEDRPHRGQLQPVIQDRAAGEIASPTANAWVAAACVVAALLAAAAVVRIVIGRAADSPYALKLTAQDNASTLRIGWDRGSEAIRRATGATVTIQDGAAAEKVVRFGRDLLETGSFIYARSSGDVTVSMKIECDCPLPVQEMIRFVDNLPVIRQPQTSAIPAAPAPRETPAGAGPIRRETGSADRQTPPPKTERSQFVPAPLRVFRPPGNQQASWITELDAPPPVDGSSSWAAAPTLAPRFPAAIPPRNQELRWKTPPAGRLIWSGLLGRNQELIIDGNRASSGSLWGMLPERPLRVNVYPADFASGNLVAYVSTPLGGNNDRWEAASPDNGWNATLFRFDPERAKGVIAVETPQASNRWRRLVIRSVARGASLILVDWRNSDGS